MNSSSKQGKSILTISGLSASGLGRYYLLGGSQIEIVPEDDDTVTAKGPDISITLVNSTVQGGIVIPFIGDISNQAVNKKEIDFENVYQEIDKSKIVNKEEIKSLVEGFERSITTETPQAARSFLLRLKDVLKNNPELLNMARSAAVRTYKACIGANL